jgi:hypothetical protein
MAKRHPLTKVKLKSKRQLCKFTFKVEYPFLSKTLIAILPFFVLVDEASPLCEDDDDFWFVTTYFGTKRLKIVFIFKYTVFENA